jgi:hypothetical protein
MNNFSKTESIIQTKEFSLFSKSKCCFRKKVGSQDEKHSSVGDPVLLNVSRLPTKADKLKSQTLKKLRKIKNKIKQVEEYQF